MRRYDNRYKMYAFDLENLFQAFYPDLGTARLTRARRAAILKTLRRLQQQQSSSRTEVAPMDH